MRTMPTWLDLVWPLLFHFSASWSGGGFQYGDLNIRGSGLFDCGRKWSYATGRNTIVFIFHRQTKTSHTMNARTIFTFLEGTTHSLLACIAITLVVHFVSPFRETLKVRLMLHHIPLAFIQYHINSNIWISCTLSLMLVPVCPIKLETIWKPIILSNWWYTSIILHCTYIGMNCTARINQCKEPRRKNWIQSFNLEREKMRLL